MNVIAYHGFLIMLGLVIGLVFLVMDLLSKGIIGGAILVAMLLYLVGLVCSIILDCNENNGKK